MGVRCWQVEFTCHFESRHSLLQFDLVQLSGLRLACTAKSQAESDTHTGESEVQSSEKIPGRYPFCSCHPRCQCRCPRSQRPESSQSSKSKASDVDSAVWGWSFCIDVVVTRPKQNKTNPALACLGMPWLAMPYRCFCKEEPSFCLVLLVFFIFKY